MSVGPLPAVSLPLVAFGGGLIVSVTLPQIIRTFRIETRKASKAVARRKVRVFCGEGSSRMDFFP